MKAVLWIGKLTLGNKPLLTTTLLNTWCLHLAVYTETLSSCWQNHTPVIPAMYALVRLAAASGSAAQPETHCMQNSFKVSRTSVLEMDAVLGTQRSKFYI